MHKYKGNLLVRRKAKLCASCTIPSYACPATYNVDNAELWFRQKDGCNMHKSMERRQKASHACPAGRDDATHSSEPKRQKAIRLGAVYGFASSGRRRPRWTQGLPLAPLRLPGRCGEGRCGEAVLAPPVPRRLLGRWAQKLPTAPLHSEFDCGAAPGRRTLRWWQKLLADMSVSKEDAWAAQTAAATLPGDCRGSCSGLWTEIRKRSEPSRHAPSILSRSDSRGRGSSAGMDDGSTTEFSGRFGIT